MENFTSENINDQPASHIDREEILRLRAERKEQRKIAKESKLESQTDELISSLQDALIQRESEINAEELRKKLEYYLQKNPEKIDTSILADAIVESPDCVSDPDCGISGLLKSHEMKTLQKIAELRRQKAEQSGEGFNPYEALFQTESGEYYVARLLNMPHLEEESEYMNHCVGTSDSYINKIKRGEVEILSFRSTKTHEPLITIEYDLKEKIIFQIKKKSDEYISEQDEYFQDFLEALRKLKDTKTDTEEKRDFKNISETETQNILVQDYHLYTEKGEVYFENYNEKEHGFILKKGNMTLDETSRKDFAVKVLKFELDIDFKEEEIAQSKEEITENTKIYIGELYPNIFKELPKDTERIYTSFPEHEVYIETIELSEKPKTSEEYKDNLEKEGFKIYETADDLLDKADLKEGSGKKIRLIIPTVASLGFKSSATREEIQARAKEFGIGHNLLPARVGPELRLKMKDQKEGEWILIDMGSVSSRGGNPPVFGVNRLDVDLWLATLWYEPGHRWDPGRRWAFSQES